MFLYSLNSEGTAYDILIPDRRNKERSTAFDAVYYVECNDIKLGKILKTRSYAQPRSAAFPATLKSMVVF